MNGPPQSLTEYLSQEAIQFSSRVVKHLRLSSHFRVADGAVFCKVLLRFCNQAFKHTQIWTFIDWISCPVCGTNKIRIEYCLDETIEIQRMKAFQGRSRVQSIDPRLQKNVFMPQGWTEFVYHVGSELDFRSICSTGLIAGGHGWKKEGRQTCFCTAVDLISTSMPTP